jgi:hypothetical protein
MTVARGVLVTIINFVRTPAFLMTSHADSEFRVNTVPKRDSSCPAL